MEQNEILKVFRDLNHIDLLQMAIIVVVAWLTVSVLQRVIPWFAERMGGRFRLYVLPSLPVIRLFIFIAVIVFLVPRLIEPSVQNLFTIMGVVGVAVGFAFKDYVSSVIAGVIAIYEKPYRPGDWVKIDDAYGEVRSLTLRSLQLVTPDDTVVTIPHSKLWDTNIYNDTDGERDLQCITHFYVDPHHNPNQVRELLYDIALTSPYTQLANPIIVLVFEEPGYTHYKIKAYPIDARDQFQFMSDLTVRGKLALAEIHVQPVGLGAIMANQMGATSSG
jgi:small-conductance mechanosensitive channel